MPRNVRFVFLFSLLLGMRLASFGDNALVFQYQQPAAPQIPPLYEAWKAEHNPKKRDEIAAQLAEAVVHDYDNRPVNIIEEIARNGAPEREITSTIAPQIVKLDPACLLKDVHRTDWPHPSPVFRRISKHRIEAWTSKEGWLFDDQGNTVTHVIVPRRDGSGRQWYGAFLPNGMWITTDLWDNDEQLNCYNSKGKWLWELRGSDIVSRLPKPTDSLDSDRIVPSTGWARTDNTGRRWLVCEGWDYTRGYALVDPQGRFQPLPENPRLWNLVYPRSMGVRGEDWLLVIESDDAKEAIAQEEAPHGIEVGWPNYRTDRQYVIIQDGNDHFGFWPHSRRIYIEAGRDEGDPHQLWFFNADGKYEGQMPGTYLSDASNERNILVKAPNDQVMEVTVSNDGLYIAHIRNFKWSDGSEAVPLALYDDLKLGFFFQAPAVTADDAGKDQSKAEIVLARWGN